LDHAGPLKRCTCEADGAHCTHKQGPAPLTRTSHCRIFENVRTVRTSRPTAAPMPIDHDSHEATTSRSARDTRLHLRASAREDALIRLAAQSVDKTVTEFVLDSASQAAEQVLADRRWFLLDEESWAAFEAALDRPAVFKPRLAELLNEQDYFEA
jgi:uncharacterized protein (DUF1778 family)